MELDLSDHPDWPVVHHGGTANPLLDGCHRCTYQQRMPAYQAQMLHPAVFPYEGDQPDRTLNVEPEGLARILGGNLLQELPLRYRGHPQHGTVRSRRHSQAGRH